MATPKFRVGDHVFYDAELPLGSKAKRTTGFITAFIIDPVHISYQVEIPGEVDLMGRPAIAVWLERDVRLVARTESRYGWKIGDYLVRATDREPREVGRVTSIITSDYEIEQVIVEIFGTVAERVSGYSKKHWASVECAYADSVSRPVVAPEKTVWAKCPCSETDSSASCAGCGKPLYLDGATVTHYYDVSDEPTATGPTEASLFWCYDCVDDDEKPENLAPNPIPTPEEITDYVTRKPGYVFPPTVPSPHRSPSKEMMDAGKAMADGLRVGLELSEERRKFKSYTEAYMRDEMTIEELRERLQADATMVPKMPGVPKGPDSTSYICQAPHCTISIDVTSTALSHVFDPGLGPVTKWRCECGHYNSIVVEVPF